MVDKKLKDYKLISLFDGIGGFPLAWAKTLGVKHQDLKYTSSEIEVFLTRILDMQFPKVKQLFDIEKVDLNKLKGDIVTMGTPCTGFSISGVGDGLENIESRLFKDGVEAIKIIKPSYFVWENVFGVFSANKRQEIRSILEYFKTTGYDIAWSMLDTKFFGLPQRRRRMYVIGFKNGIPENNNIFDFKARQTKEKHKEAKDFEANNFEFDLNKKSTCPSTHYAFFNRQRSDKFKEVGISNTIAKRDFKGSTDLVIKNGSIRRIVPIERLRLQGIPDYFFDATYETQKGDKPRFQANGMSVPVVSYVFDQIEKHKENLHLIDGDFKRETFKSKNLLEERFKINKKGEREFLILPHSGQMRFDRNESGNIKNKETVTFSFPEKCIESSPNLKSSKIEDILENEVELKYHITKNSLMGMLRRSVTSEEPLPKKLKEVIFYKYPDLILHEKSLIEDFKNGIEISKDVK